MVLILEYINLLTNETFLKVIGFGFLTIIVMAIVEVSYRVEMMGEDNE